MNVKRQGTQGTEELGFEQRNPFLLSISGPPSSVWSSFPVSLQSDVGATTGEINESPPLCPHAHVLDLG